MCIWSKFGCFEIFPNIDVHRRRTPCRPGPQIMTDVVSPSDDAFDATTLAIGRKGVTSS